MAMLNKGDTAALVCCSNGLRPSEKQRIDTLADILGDMGIRTAVSPVMYAASTPYAGTGKKRAEAFMELYCRKDVRAVFDVSGGDLANEVLPHLDYGIFIREPKPVFGYSDLTVLLNAVNASAGMETYLYQIRNLTGACGDRQREEFYRTAMGSSVCLYDFEFKFLRGKEMEGIMAGGNIRCLLKLAGTPWWPDFAGKLLFLESRSGDAAKMATYLCQLEQTGVLDKVNGILLGTFTQMEKEGCRPRIEELVLNITEKRGIPVAATPQIGHGSDSKCLILGRKYCLNFQGKALQNYK